MRSFNLWENDKSMDSGKRFCRAAAAVQGIIDRVVEVAAMALTAGAEKKVPAKLVAREAR
jgi:hypothetical protein